MIREVDLIPYLPPRMQEYYELQKIMAAENPEFQQLWNVNEQIRKDLFILTAEEQGLRRLENIMGLFPSEDDTFESRRMRILTRWNDSLPYSFRYLIGMLEVITGGNYEIINHFNEYEMEIITHIGTRGGVDDLQHLFRTVIPANMVVVSNNILDINSTGSLRVASATIPTVVYMVTNDFEVTYEMAGMAAHGSTLVQSGVERITNDFEAVVSVNGSAGNRSTAIVVTEYQI